MGCDIHAYIDYSFKDFDGEERAIGFAKVHIPRSYGMFTVMAGVRAYGAEVQQFEPKGLPDKVSYHVEDGYTLFVVDSKTEEPGFCSREEADRYLKYGSKYWGDDEARVTHPDMHTPSWLTTDELKLAYKRFREYYIQSVLPVFNKGMDEDEINKEFDRVRGLEEPVSPIPEVEAAIGAMEALDKMGNQARLVFWFDN